MATEETKCEICGCECKPTLHHLVPQQVSRHKNKFLKTDEGNFLWICEECHSQIHALYSNQELKDRLFTKELLLADPKFHKYVELHILFSLTEFLNVDGLHHLSTLDD